MSTHDSKVIATARTAREAFTRLESAAEKPGATPRPSPVQAAAALALMNRIVASIEKAQKEVGDGIMTSPDASDDKAREASILLSLLAEGAVESEPLTQGGREAKFDTRDWWGWAGVAIAKIKHLRPHPIARPPVHISPFPHVGRIAVLGDWGTNLYGAPVCAQSIARDPGAFAMLLHLGDVYYSGTSKEVKQRFLDAWPKRSDANLLQRAINSNHEMYSGGDAYFGVTLPAFGQSASYFAFANDHWLLVGLDTAYVDHDMDEEQVAWLRLILDHPGAKNRKVVLFSHQQLFSRHDSQGWKLDAAIGDLLREGRVKAWYWGHEHRCCIYEPHAGYGGMYARCIGHSGMPEARKVVGQWPLDHQSPTPEDTMLWRRFSATSVTASGRHLDVPAGLVLDGRNRYIEREEEKFAPHGYATLEFNGPQLTERVLTPGGYEIHRAVIA